MLPSNLNNFGDKLSSDDLPDVLNQSRDLLKTYNSKHSSSEVDKSSSLGFFYDKYK